MLNDLYIIIPHPLDRFTKMRISEVYNNMGLLRNFIDSLDTMGQERIKMMKEQERKEDEHKALLQKGYNSYPSEEAIHNDIINTRKRDIELQSRMAQVIQIMRNSNADQILLHNLESRYYAGCFEYADLLKSYGYDLSQVEQYIVKHNI